jgi:hypothetical protein
MGQLTLKARTPVSRRICFVLDLVNDAALMEEHWDGRAEIASLALYPALG